MRRSSSRRTTTGRTAGCSKPISAPIADEGDLPIVVYNVPSRTGSNVDADTFLRLAEHPRVVAVKEASGNLDQIARICRDRPRDVAVLAGDDAWTLAILAMGGDGVVSVASNEIPTELVALCAAARAGDWEGARRTHERWLPLFQGNFRGGPNPVPAKAALALMGLLESDMVRAPLLPIDPDGRAAMAVDPPRPGPARDRRRPDRRPAGLARGRGVTAELELAGRAAGAPAAGRRPSSRAGSSTTSRPVASARPSPIRPRPTAGGSGPRSRRRSSPASRIGRRSTGRPVR